MRYMWNLKQTIIFYLFDFAMREPITVQDPYYITHPFPVGGNRSTRRKYVTFSTALTYIFHMRTAFESIRGGLTENRTHDLRDEWANHFATEGLFLTTDSWQGNVTEFTEVIRKKAERKGNTNKNRSNAKNILWVRCRWLGYKSHSRTTNMIDNCLINVMFDKTILGKNLKDKSKHTNPTTCHVSLNLAT